MVNAPERIWASQTGAWLSHESPSQLEPAEFVRADLYEQVKRERDDAKQALQNEIVAHGNTIRGKSERLAGVRVVVKPLEWGPYPNPVFAGPDIAVAPFSVFGNYFYQVQRNPRGPGFIAFVAPLYGETTWESNKYDCIEAAKAAAQADFERRILSALAEPAGEAEPVKHGPGCGSHNDYPCDCQALTTPPDVSAIREALPVTGPYVDRLIRIFQNRPDDDTSAVVLQDYARAALAGAKP